jgi:hypothetical protein
MVSMTRLRNLVAKERILILFNVSIAWHYPLQIFYLDYLNILLFARILICFSTFSNRYIAAAGINQNTGKSKLYLLDIETGDKELLPEIIDVWSLAWGHDSRQLASLNWPSFRMCTQSI